MRRFWIAVVLAITVVGAWGCDSHSIPTPTPIPSPPPPAPLFTLSGVVTEETATGVAPVEGAVVVDNRSARRVATDENGRYSLAGLQAGSRNVTTTKTGYVPSTTVVAIDADAQLDVRIAQDRAYIISGVVFENTPSGRVVVPDAQLYCDSCGSPSGHTFTSSDAEGRYSFGWATVGVHPLFVDKPGYALARIDDSHGRIHATVMGDTRLDIEVVRVRR